MNTNRKDGRRDFDHPVRLMAVLAESLLAAPEIGHPGADGATIEEVVAAEYPAAAADGRVPCQAELATRFPEMADMIGAFFQTGSDFPRGGGTNFDTGNSRQ